MRHRTAILIWAGMAAAPVFAAETIPADRFGSPHQSTISRVPLLPGPYLLSPAGSASPGHSWKVLTPGKGELSLKESPNPAPAPTRPSEPAGPQVKKPSAPPAAESLKFREQLPELKTSLRAQPAPTTDTTRRAPDPH